MEPTEVQKLSSISLRECAEVIARFLMSYSTEKEPAQIVSAPQFINKDLLKIKTFLGSPYKEMIYKFQVFNFDENLSYVKNIPLRLSIENIQLTGDSSEPFSVNSFGSCRGSDSAALSHIMMENPALAHIVAQEYYKNTGVELNLELTTYLAIAYIVEKLVSLEKVHHFKKSDQFLSHRDVQEQIRLLDAFINFSMNGFKNILLFDEQKMYETIQYAYDSTQYVKSSPQSLRDSWMFEWEGGILSEMPVYQPMDIVKILSHLQGNFIDTGINLYEDKETLADISGSFFLHMKKYVFKGIESSPWVQAALQN